MDFFETSKEVVIYIKKYIRIISQNPYCIET